jgi:hypothetical protein
MGGAIVALFAVAVAIAALGATYRRARSKSLPTISDEEFLRHFLAQHATRAAPEAILTERRQIARTLGVAPEKLTAEQSVKSLSDRLTYLADFSVAWNDLADEAAEARQASGLGPREDPPSTIGELIEDRLAAAR